MPVQQHYNFSFTAASLRLELVRIVAEAYAAIGDWKAAKEHVLSHNALQARSASSAIRMERELRQRLQTLTNEQLHL
ncbi:MAG: putative inner rane protein, partial [Proteobacteria bacterium]|nr:putative inner rane protein [Pseudomonadota bacterium]